MANRHLNPTFLGEHSWYYETLKGIELIVEPHAQTSHNIITWRHLRAALRRWDKRKKA